MPGLPRLTAFVSLLSFSLLTTTTACKKKAAEPAPPAASTRASEPAVTAPAPAPAAPPVEPPATPAADPMAGWKVHKGAEGFTVTGPNEPRVTTQNVPTKLGDLPATTYMYNAPGAPGAMMIMVVPIPKAARKDLDVDKLLTDSRDGMVTSGVKVTKEEKITVGGTAGLDVMFGGEHPQMGPFAGRARLFYKDGSLYQVQVLRAGDALAFGNDGDKFLESFAFGI